MSLIYVAGGSDEKDACRADIDALTAAGWTVSFDWTRNPGDVSGDVSGVIFADVVWVRLPDGKSEGSHCELGIAVGARRMGRVQRIIVSGTHDREDRLFPQLADMKFRTHAEAMRWLIEEAHG